MTFLYPNTIFIMIFPLLLLAYLILTNTTKLSNTFSKDILEKLTYNSSYTSKNRVNIYTILALISIIFALARPVVLKENLPLKQNLPQLAIVLDISNSMLSNDIYPNRVTFAKTKIIELLDNFKSLNLSIYAMSEKVFLLSAKTTDIKTTKFILNHLHIKSSQQKSTNFIELFNQLKDEKNIVIFTDGDKKSDFHNELKLIKKYRQKVYIYATSTLEGGAIKIDNNFLVDNNKIVISKLNQNISILCDKSGGIFNLYSYDKNSTKKIANAIKKTPIMLENIDYIEKNELFKYPIYLSLIFIFLAFYSLKNDDTLRS